MSDRLNLEELVLEMKVFRECIGEEGCKITVIKKEIIALSKSKKNGSKVHTSLEEILERMYLMHDKINEALDSAMLSIVDEQTKLDGCLEKGDNNESNSSSAAAVIH